MDKFRETTHQHQELALSIINADRMPASMNVLYLLSQYVSHHRAGVDYLDCLRLINGVKLVEHLDQAEVVIIHDEPPTYPLYFERLPILRSKYVIGYAVWETEQLPKLYFDCLRLVREVWTCSQFSYKAIARMGFPVYLVPHVIRKIPPKIEQVKAFKQAIAYDKEAFYFYTIVDSINPRKNLPAMLYNFTRLFPALDSRVFLIVKQYRKVLDYVGAIPQVISLGDNLDQGAIDALHLIGNCYLSTHCSEAWGLSMADAMACGNPVIATGYSGNLEFMNEENSFLSRYNLVQLNEEEIQFQPRLLDRTMRWASVDNEHFRELMKVVWKSRELKDLRSNALKVVQRFGLDPIARIIEERLSAISSDKSS